MKIRNGFISNSSSSSFVILSKEKVTKEQLFKIFNVPKDHILYDFSNGIVNYILRSLEEYKIRDLIDDYCVDTIEELPEIYQRAAKNNLKIFKGSASDECSYPEKNWLCSATIKYESEDFIFNKEGGY